MNTDTTRTRRAMLRVAGATASSALVAGCLDESTTDSDPEESTDDGSGDEGSPTDDDSSDDGSESNDTDADSADDGADGDISDDGEGTPEETDSSTDADESDSDDDAVDGAYEIEPGTEIRLSGQTAHWEGLAPAAIEGRENPTLVLEAGEDYAIGWVEGDGAAHNIQVRNDDDEVVDDLETEVTTEPGEVLEFTAREEMAVYVCHPHQYTMSGRLDVRNE